MGKRPRTPHFISGIGDGNVNLADTHNKRAPNDEYFLVGNGGSSSSNNNGKTGVASNTNGIPDRTTSNIRSRNERLARLEEPLLASDWREYRSGDSVVGNAATITTGPWPVSAFAIVGMIVILSGIVLHMISESSSESSPTYHHRRRQRQRRYYKTRKKKTDEWSDDEEEILQNGAGLPDYSMPSAPGEPTHEPQFYPYYYHQPPAVHSRFTTQEHRQRRNASATASVGGMKEPNTPPAAAASAAVGSGGGSNNYYLPHQGLVPTYKSPSPSMFNTKAGGVHRRGQSPKHSFAGGKGTPRSSSSVAGSSTHTPIHDMAAGYALTPTANNSSRMHMQISPDANSLLPPSASDVRGSRLPPAPEDQQLYMNDSHHSHHSHQSHHSHHLSQSGSKQPLNARPLNSSNFSSFASMDDNSDDRSRTSRNRVPIPPTSEESMDVGQLFAASSHLNTSQHSHHSHHLHNSFQPSSMSSRRHQSLVLSPGNFEETPLIGNMRRVMNPNLEPGMTGLDMALLSSPSESNDGIHNHVPFIPTLENSKHLQQYSARQKAATPPPRSVLMDELRLVQMETGNSTPRWEAQNMHESQDISESHASFYGDYPEQQDDTQKESSESDMGDSDLSIPSGDIRKTIIHKRQSLLSDTNAEMSLLSSVNFDELELEEVIGGGGFGQVWRATWRCTPVAVKVLTGSAQNKHIAKAILEEFKAEINLLKGMRHPNICLYMGACVVPPNRAIITELAANGSVWDALRLPLMPPFMSADGTHRGSWPSRLYLPDHHGTPPSTSSATAFATARHHHHHHHSRSNAVASPIPPKGTWPWELVKGVACGAARGMAYLHSGNPPVLHRDLKSANLLLDKSYTAKVCDFGLSRLKAQERSMTGNCGTVQWMAPEVLANMRYNEKADVYSYGIILWELLSRECPYDGMTPIQCALAVLNRDKRPDIPKWCPPALHALIRSCIKKEPNLRPSFANIILALDSMD